MVSGPFTWLKYNLFRLNGIKEVSIAVLVQQRIKEGLTKTDQHIHEKQTPASATVFWWLSQMFKRTFSGLLILNDDLPTHWNIFIWFLDGPNINPVEFEADDGLTKTTELHY